MDLLNKMDISNNIREISSMAGRSPAIGHGLHFNVLDSGAMNPLKRREGAIYPGLMAAMVRTDCRDGLRWTVCNCGHGTTAEAFRAEAYKRNHKYH
jgi:hypothetical protein